MIFSLFFMFITKKDRAIAETEKKNSDKPKPKKGVRIQSSTGRRKKGGIFQLYVLYYFVTNQRINQ
jgi:hypothetical protein